MELPQATPALETTYSLISTRNQAVRIALEAGRLPILPFEKIVIEGQLGRIMDEQDALGQELGQVNHQGSETWHDNFAANNIESHSRVVHRRGSKLAETLHGAVALDYPPDGDEVTVGSLLEVMFPSDEQATQAILTGTVRELDESIDLALPDRLTFITLQSPIGVALLGARPGETISYGVDGRQLKVQVLSVRQLQVA